MAKTIKIPYGGKTYTLEYSRKIASMMEKQGFNIMELDKKPATMVPMLFHGAFLMHHPNTKGDTKEKIYDGLKNRSNLIQALAEMYAETYNTLFDDGEDEGDEGNPGWEMTE